MTKTTQGLPNPSRKLLGPLPLCQALVGLWVVMGEALGMPQTITVLDAAGQPLRLAAVSVVVKGAKPTTSTATADMAQRSKNFVPTLLVVQTGTQVHFPNFDTVRHHVYSFSPTRAFEIKLYAGTPAAPVLFDKPGTATLGCNIHDNMLGYIHVVDTPYFGVTNATGQVVIDLPAGEHQLRVWHPGMGEATAPKESIFKPGPPVSIKLNLSPGVRVPSAPRS
jgi:plastocyanin